VPREGSNLLGRQEGDHFPGILGKTNFKHSREDKEEAKNFRTRKRGNKENNEETWRGSTPRVLFQKERKKRKTLNYENRGGK